MVTAWASAQALGACGPRPRGECSAYHVGPMGYFKTASGSSLLKSNRKKIRLSEETVNAHGSSAE